ncbi:hypothetical protein ACF052_04860 [Streptomyces pilosus]|uniref:hypothetical protein n=1 Tax=Streptomyces pilosus TaxID=28893 RepID=UPI0036FE79A1
MPLFDEEREELRTGASLAAFSSALFLVVGVIWGFPWQMVLLLVVVSVAVAGLITAMSLPDARRDALRRAASRDTLIAWAGRNGWRYGTELADFTTDGKGWELLESAVSGGQLLAVGRRDGVDVGISCFTELWGEAGVAWRTAVLVRLPEERPPTRLRRREIRQLDLPQEVESVKIDGRELSVRYEGWPVTPLWLDSRVDAAVRLAASLPNA